MNEHGWLTFCSMFHNMWDKWACMIKCNMTWFHGKILYSHIQQNNVNNRHIIKMTLHKIWQ